MKSQFLDLLRESTIFQGTITVIVLAIWVFAQIQAIVYGRPVPPEITTITGTVVGFFFGGKFTQAVAKTSADSNAAAAVTADMVKSVAEAVKKE